MYKRAPKFASVEETESSAAHKFNWELHRNDEGNDEESRYFDLKFLALG